MQLLNDDISGGVLVPCAHHHAEKSNDKLNSIITHTCTLAIGNPAGLAIVVGGARWPAHPPIGPPPPADQYWAEILVQSGASVGQKSGKGGAAAKEACSSLETMWSGQNLQGLQHTASTTTACLRASFPPSRPPARPPARPPVLTPPLCY
ncbi:hypothetical protein E2C01_027256 [Portunus trituberculatus]|uniref:Uncharacterized protein n=1 Tax=Portunus trituberculatus TaxID=210409 RepID=A0A5B7EL66_PORTR|nr:hypothetical protein [Portunus trituberculatus]